MAAVLGVRFLLELALFAVTFWWGSEQFSGVTGFLVGALMAIALALVWGLLISPKARIRLPAMARVAIEVLLFGLGALALVDLGRPWWGAALLIGDLVVIALLALRRGGRSGWSPHDVQQ